MEREREVGAAAYYRFMVVKSEKLPMSSWRELLDFRFQLRQRPPILRLVHYLYLLDKSRFNEDLVGARALALWLQGTVLQHF